jgi:hypothetical protein
MIDASILIPSERRRVRIVRVDARGRSPPRRARRRSRMHEGVALASRAPSVGHDSPGDPR